MIVCLWDITPSVKKPWPLRLIGMYEGPEDAAIAALAIAARRPSIRPGDLVLYKESGRITNEQDTVGPNMTQVAQAILACSKPLRQNNAGFFVELRHPASLFTIGFSIEKIKK